MYACRPPGMVHGPWRSPAAGAPRCCESAHPRPPAASRSASTERRSLAGADGVQPSSSPARVRPHAKVFLPASGALRQAIGPGMRCWTQPPAAFYRDFLPEQRRAEQRNPAAGIAQGCGPGHQPEVHQISGSKTAGSHLLSSLRQRDETAIPCSDRMGNGSPDGPGQQIDLLPQTPAGNAVRPAGGDGRWVMGPITEIECPQPHALPYAEVG